MPLVTTRLANHTYHALGYHAAGRAYSTNHALCFHALSYQAAGEVYSTDHAVSYQAAGEVYSTIQQTASRTILIRDVCLGPALSVRGSQPKNISD